MAAPAEPLPLPEEAGGERQDGGDDGGREALRSLEALLAELFRFRARLRGADGCYDDSDDDGDESDGDGGGGDSSGDSDGDGDDGDGDGGAARRRRRELLRAEVRRTLRRMEQVAVPRGQRAQALVLRARALSVAPGGDTAAAAGGDTDTAGDAGDAAAMEEALRRAVKLAPGLAAAWWHLGRLRWRRGDVAGARLCFRGALAHGPHKGALRGLSVALRRGGDAGAAAQSVEHAKAAVRLDPRDGRSWYVLGNAYVSLFFTGGQSPGAARSALAAYARAEQVDPRAARNADLHLNRAALLQFAERFGAALAALARARELRPGWAEPRRRRRRLRRFLRRLCRLLQLRGKVPARRLRRLLAALPPALLGPLGTAPTPVAALAPGANPGRALLLRALFSLAPPEGVPVTVGAADAAGTPLALNVFNAAPGWAPRVGDALALASPVLRQHRVEDGGEVWSFCSVRVPTPLALLLNGRPLPPAAQAPARVACRPPATGGGVKGGGAGTATPDDGADLLGGDADLDDVIGAAGDVTAVTDDIAHVSIVARDVTDDVTDIADVTGDVTNASTVANGVTSVATDAAHAVADDVIGGGAQEGGAQ